MHSQGRQTALSFEQSSSWHQIQHRARARHPSFTSGVRVPGCAYLFTRNRALIFLFVSATCDVLFLALTKSVYTSILFLK